MRHSKARWLPSLLSLGIGCTACIVPIELLDTESETSTEGETGAQSETTTVGETGSELGARLLALRIPAMGTMDVLTVDPVTGTSNVLGQMGSFDRGDTDAAISPDGSTVYALGYPADDSNVGTLYAFDLGTDTFGYEVAHGGALDRATLVGFDHLDRLTALRLPALGKMEVLTIDPVTGVTNVIGQMGSLDRWHINIALSPDRTTLYTLGYPADDAEDGSLYAFDLATGTFDHEVTHGGVLNRAHLVGVDHLGRLLAVLLPALGTMDVLTVDPVTGTSNVIGQMGSLDRWHTNIALSPDRTVLYTLGYPTDDAPDGSLYAFNLATDTFGFEVAHGGVLNQASLIGFGM